MTGPSPGSSPGPDTQICSVKQLGNLLTYWQKAMKLSDWDVRLKIVRQHDLLEGTQAMIESNHDHRIATVSICDPHDYQPQEFWPQDMEVSLVHELVHLTFWWLNPEKESLQQTLEEQSVEAVAQALVEQRRRIPKTSSKTSSKKNS